MSPSVVWWLLMAIYNMLELSNFCSHGPIPTMMCNHYKDQGHLWRAAETMLECCEQYLLWLMMLFSELAEKLSSMVVHKRSSRI